jgi:guanosine-3',5'-bis(diphosphate) 3'-pyrophosphohydrolase
MQNQLILKAVDFAAKKHRDHRRKDEAASPYINHLIEVALLLFEVGGIEDPEILAAALLHDTLEDTRTDTTELAEQFGTRICRLVEEVSDDKSLPREVRKDRQISHAGGLSPEATLIKLADKISNVTDTTHSPPPDWSVERRIAYLDWAEAVVNQCPRVNRALENRFRKLLAAGRKSMQA